MASLSKVSELLPKDFKPVTHPSAKEGKLSAREVQGFVIANGLLIGGKDSFNPLSKSEAEERLQAAVSTALSLAKHLEAIQPRRVSFCERLTLFISSFWNINSVD